MNELLTGYELVVGVFLPLLISIFVKEHWSKELKVGISFAFVLLASIGHLFYSGEWDLGNWTGSLLKILVITVTLYKGFWLGTGITDFLEKKVGLTDGKEG